jgi:hypothetical protein
MRRIGRMQEQQQRQLLFVGSTARSFSRRTSHISSLVSVVVDSARQ